MASWKERHNAAMVNPVAREEREIVSLVVTMGELRKTYRTMRDIYGGDYVLSGAVNDVATAVQVLASAVLTLLEGEHGRLDASTVDTLVRDHVVGVDGDPDLI